MYVCRTSQSLPREPNPNPIYPPAGALDKLRLYVIGALLRARVAFGVQAFAVDLNSFTSIQIPPRTPYLPQKKTKT